MIVGDYFEGDVAVARAQHDVYGTALRVLLQECRNLVAAAHLIAETTKSISPTLPDVDHRSVQMAHDLIAAAWRFRSLAAEPMLPLGDGMHDLLGDPVRPVDAWLRWLRLEVRSWIDEPRLATLLWTIVEYQDTPPGYAAEDALTGALFERYADVPWSPGKLTFKERLAS